MQRCLTLQRRECSQGKIVQRWKLRLLKKTSQKSACHCGTETQLIKTVRGAKCKSNNTGLESLCLMTHAQRGLQSTDSQAAGEAHPSIPLHLPMTSSDKSVPKRQWVSLLPTLSPQSVLLLRVGDSVKCRRDLIDEGPHGCFTPYC